MKYEKAIKKAEEVLEKFDINKAPVPIADVVRNLGIRIGYAPSMKYSGILIRKSDGNALLGVNSTESPVRMRFTIAHELGHFFLDDKKEKVSIDYRNTYGSENIKSLKEKEVDEFAANILMPKFLLEKDFFEITKKKVFLEEHLALLADIYEVSREAMKVRITILGLI